MDYLFKAVMENSDLGWDPTVFFFLRLYTFLNIIFIGIYSTFQNIRLNVQTFIIQSHSHGQQTNKLIINNNNNNLHKYIEKL